MGLLLDRFSRRGGEGAATAGANSGHVFGQLDLYLAPVVPPVA